MKRSNLTQFFSDSNIQSPKEYFDASKLSIKKLILEQTEHEHRALRCIIEIGKTLSELQDYKKRIKSEKVDGLWTGLINDISLSPSTVTKYIKISENPIITDKRFFSQIPPSVYSLYELSKLDPIALQLLIESDEVNATSGRTAIKSITSSNQSIPKTLKNQVPLVTLYTDKNNLISAYQDIEFELKLILEKYKITAVFSSQIQTHENTEATRMKKVEAYVFQQAKKFFKQVVKIYVDNECRRQYLCPPNTPFKKKIKLLKYCDEEITTESCTTTNEIQELLIGLGLVDESEWNQPYSKWFADGLEKYPSKLSSLRNEPNEARTIESISEIFTPVKKQRVFSGFKV